jgi:hypothetical protein
MGDQLQTRIEKLYTSEFSSNNFDNDDLSEIAQYAELVWGQPISKNQALTQNN